VISHYDKREAEIPPENFPQEGDFFLGGKFPGGNFPLGKIPPEISSRM